jgi:hypothetical protein
MAQPLPRWVSVLAGILGVVLCMGLVLGVRSFDMLTATARTEGMAVWVHTPFVAPGDDLTVEVEVYGGARAAIDSIAVRGEGFSTGYKGRGKDWGALIAVRAGDVGKDALTVSIKLPASVTPDRTLDLEIAALSTVAERRFGALAQYIEPRSVRVRVHVRTPAGRIQAKLLAALQALLLLALVTVAFRLLWHPVARRLLRADTQREQGLSQALGILAIDFAIPYVMAGIVAFAYPMRHATLLLGDAWTFAFSLVWIGLPPYVGRRLAGPRPSEPEPAVLRPAEGAPVDATGGYRETGVRRRATIAQLQEALGKVEGAKVAVKGRDIEVRWKKPRSLVTLRAQADEVSVAELEVEYDSLALVVEVTRALAYTLGPIELVVEELPVAFEPGMTDVEMLQRVTEWQQRILARLSARLRRL